MGKSKIVDVNLKAKYHENDLIQVDTENESVSIIQESAGGGKVLSFLTFEAVEELYNEVKKQREKNKKQSVDKRLNRCYTYVTNKGKGDDDK